MNRGMSQILSTFLLVAIAAPSVVSTTGCMAGVNKYNTLINLDEECNRMEANMKVQYKRRSELLGQLVPVVKAAAQNEKEALEAVMSARASATKIQVSAKDLDNPENMAKLQKAQGEFQAAFGRLMMVQEKYPQLASQARFTDLFAEIVGSQNSCSQMEANFNDAVTEYNREFRRLSVGKVVIHAAGADFQKRDYLEIPETAMEAPDVGAMLE